MGLLTPRAVGRGWGAVPGDLPLKSHWPEVLLLPPRPPVKCRSGVSGPLWSPSEGPCLGCERLFSRV